MKNKPQYCSIRFVFQTKCKISNFFAFKDKIPSFLRSGIVYKFGYSGCNASYYGKTKRHFEIRMCEHFRISTLTGKRVKVDDDSAIKEHLLFCNHAPDFEDFSILAANNNDFNVTLMESLLIDRDHPPLNKNKQYLPLELFDNLGTNFHHMISREIDSCCCSSFILRVVLLSHEFYIMMVLIL